MYHVETPREIINPLTLDGYASHKPMECMPMYGKEANDSTGCLKMLYRHDRVFVELQVLNPFKYSFILIFALLIKKTNKVNLPV